MEEHRPPVAGVGTQAVEFIAIDRLPQGLPAWGLEPVQLQRRLFVETTDGRLLSGVDAWLALWQALPPRRWRARLLRLPLLRAGAVLAYELLRPRGRRRRGTAAALHA